MAIIKETGDTFYPGEWKTDEFERDYFKFTVPDDPEPGAFYRIKIFNDPYMTIADMDSYLGLGGYKLNKDIDKISERTVEFSRCTDNYHEFRITGTGHAPQILSTVYNAFMQYAKSHADIDIWHFDSYEPSRTRVYAHMEKPMFELGYRMTRYRDELAEEDFFWFAKPGLIQKKEAAEIKESLDYVQKGEWGHSMGLDIYNFVITNKEKHDIRYSIYFDGANGDFTDDSTINSLLNPKGIMIKSDHSFDNESSLKNRIEIRFSCKDDDISDYMNNNTMRWGINDKGNAPLVLSTVYNIVMDYIRSHSDIEVWSFTSHEPSRTRLYRHITPIIEKLGYKSYETIYKDYEDRITVFYFIKPELISIIPEESDYDDEYPLAESIDVSRLDEMLDYTAPGKWDLSNSRKDSFSFFIKDKEYVVEFSKYILDEHSLEARIEDSKEYSRGLRFTSRRPDKRFKYINISFMLKQTITGEDEGVEYESSYSTYDITGTGDAPLVLSTVFNAVIKYLNDNHDIDFIGFSSHAESRTKVYNLLERPFNKLGYQKFSYTVDFENTTYFYYVKSSLISSEVSKTESFIKDHYWDNLLVESELHEILDKSAPFRIKQLSSDMLDYDFNVAGIDYEAKYKRVSTVTIKSLFDTILPGIAKMYIENGEPDFRKVLNIVSKYANKKRTLDISLFCFVADNNVDYITGSGNAPIVFSTVVSIMRDMLAKTPSKILMFGSWGPSGEEPSKYKLYHTMCRYCKQKGFISDFYEVIHGQTVAYFIIK